MSSRREMKERIQLAYRARAGIIGLLGSCICTYPLEKHPTASDHHEMCPAHYMTMRARELAAAAAAAKEAP